MPQSPGLRFAVDEMLGKLARWLRIMGLDTAHIRPFPDDLLIKTAIDESRIILTRDTKIAVIKPPPEVWFIEENLPFHQLAWIIRRAGIDPMEKAFTRCAMCNDTLVDISKEEARGKVPPFVYATHDQYRLCGRCDKIYWSGSHRARMERLFREIKKYIDDSA